MERQFYEEKLCAYMNPAEVYPTDSLQRPQPALETRITRWNSQLSNYLVADAFLIKSKVNGESRFKALLRWHALSSTILSGSLSIAWSSWMSWSLNPRFTLQNIIAAESPAVEACCRSDVPLMRELLSSGNIRPNDITEDNRTLLHVSAHPPSLDESILMVEL